MKKWLETLLDEKGIDRQTYLEVEGKSGLNIIPVQIVINAIAAAPASEKKAIKHNLVKIDFCNGDVLDYIRHLAQAIAI